MLYLCEFCRIGMKFGFSEKLTAGSHDTGVLAMKFSMYSPFFLSRWL